MSTPDDPHDHRRIGADLDLFHIQEEAAGSVFWHPNGLTLFQTIEDYMRRRLRASGYREIRTPQLVDRVLWERSGHWENFKKNMFIAEGGDERIFAVKPMNCPGAVQVFNARTQSYRDLPLRLAEFGVCHRAEPSGALHGLMRVRQFTQDDAHIFCTEEQVESETAAFIALLRSVYKAFGFDDPKIGLSTRPTQRAGDDATWDRAEAALMGAVEAAGIAYEVYPGEGAFYGPKLEFALKDRRGREWQCGTLQLDFVLPSRLDAEYVGADGKRRPPVLLHRAILGSFERFIGILLEHYECFLPKWLAPVQVAVTTARPGAEAYASETVDRLVQAGLRVVADFTDGNLKEKIKNFSIERIPVIVTVGPRDAENSTIAIRHLRDENVFVLDRRFGIDSLMLMFKTPE